jgi:uncharacterized membrane protein
MRRLSELPVYVVDQVQFHCQALFLALVEAISLPLSLSISFHFIILYSIKIISLLDIDNRLLLIAYLFFFCFLFSLNKETVYTIGAFKWRVPVRAYYEGVMQMNDGSFKPYKVQHEFYEFRNYTFNFAFQVNLKI